MTRVNRLATPMPDSVMDRYYAEHPDEVDHRRHKTAAKKDPRDKEGPATGVGVCGAWYEYTKPSGSPGEQQCTREDTTSCHYCKAPTCPRHAKSIAGHTTCYRNHN